MNEQDPQNTTLEQRSAWTLDALNHLDQGITVFDHELRLVAWNQRWYELLDFPKELAVANQHIEALFRFNAERGEYGAGDIEQQVAERVALAARFRPHVFERVRPDGTIIEIRGNPMDNGGFVTTYTDVTEQRHAEARLEQRVIKRTEDLHKSELWIRQIADAVPALIAYVDKDNRYQFINNMHQEWFGLNHEQLIGTSIFDLVEPRNLRQFRRDVAAVLEGREVQSEYQLGRKGRPPLDVSISFIPHFDDHQQMLGYFFLGQDLTEYKQTQRELIESQKMQALGRLTGGIAHDFNNLLTIILGNLNFLEDFSEDNVDFEELEEVVDCCQQAARRGSELIQRMLTFSRRQPLKPEACCLNTLVNNFSSLLSRTLGETIHIEQRLGHNLPPIRIDRNQLETCLLNLALNARDAMPQGGRLLLETRSYKKPEQHPTFTDLPAGDYIMLSVCDEGDGMDAETISRAFEPFYTTKPSGVGTGLGLSMVYGFVKQSEGGIDIRSRIGEGTRIRLIFPAQAAAIMTDNEQDTGQPHEERHGRILLVEDDDGVRSFVNRSLQKMGSHVDQAETGDAAVAKLAGNSRYDLVLTDIVMPGSVSGLELYSKINADYPDIRVLCMTGYSETVDDVLSEEHLLRKPFQRDQLASKLQEILEN
ncbi:MAG: PAS-domain containing protein [Thiolinea sp.]